MNDTRRELPYSVEASAALTRALLVGQAPWQRPWSTPRPYNATSGIRHKGIAGLLLQAQGYQDPRWLTLDQAEELGATLKPGERGTRVPYWQFTEQRPKRNWLGRPVRGADGKPQMVTVRLEHPKQYFVAVFNAEQFEGMAAAKPLPQREPPALRIEQLLAGAEVKVRHGSPDVRYSPHQDVVSVPVPSGDRSQDVYYATVLQGLARSTGHASRMNRDQSHPRGTPGHAREELRVAIASSLLGDNLGISYVPKTERSLSAAWVQLLRDDPHEIFRAAADAEQMVESVLQPERSLSNTVEQATARPRKCVQLLSLNRDRAQSRPEPQAFVEAAPRVPFVELPEQWGQPAVPVRPAGPAVADSGLQPSFDRSEDQPAPSELVTEVDPEDPDVQLLPIEERGVAVETSPVPTRAAEAPEVTSALDLAEPQFEAAVASQAAQRQAAGDNDAAAADTPDASIEESRTLQQASLSQMDGGATVKNTAEQVPEPGKQAQRPRSYGRPKLAVPYAERQAAKALGAAWDPDVRIWYAKADVDVERLTERWGPDSLEVQGPDVDPRQELADKLQSMGFILGDEHPIMDGRPHRCPVEGDSRKSHKAGFYVAFADGRPAAYIKNNRTKEEARWRAKGYVLDAATRDRMRAISAARAQQHREAVERRHAAAAAKVKDDISRLAPLGRPTPYMEKKGLSMPTGGGVFTTADGTWMHVPLQDVEGNICSAQYIGPDGGKIYARGGRLQGCFHVVGGVAALDQVEALVIAEGYATSASVAELLGRPVVAAMDSGNLRAVATALHAKYPDKPVLVVADDDRHNERNPKVGFNTGVVEAQKAADAVGGTVFKPVFAPDEQRADSRDFKDFNDLATKSAVGRAAAQEQVRGAFRVAVESHRHAVAQALVQSRSRQELGR